MDDFEAKHGASRDISVKRLTELGNVGCLSLNQRIAPGLQPVLPVPIIAAPVQDGVYDYHLTLQ
jgi:hypothetical protein